VTSDCRFVNFSVNTVFSPTVVHTLPTDVYLCISGSVGEIYISQIYIYININNRKKRKRKSAAMWIANRWVSVPPDICAG